MTEDRKAIVEKIKQYELEGRFDEDVEDDPPSPELFPDDVDYVRRKKSQKIATWFAFRTARLYLNKLLNSKTLIIKEIIGTENLTDVTTGAILTCNHFSAMDSFAIHAAYEACKGRWDMRFYRVIREGNYTNFPGYFGYLMRNCHTLPLSRNQKTMMKFMRGVDTLLKEGNYVLVYPEQSMWWNYRKPKPLKDGAFKFAVRANVPVVPFYIEQNDSKEFFEADGDPKQEYTIHIGKPIYPKEELNSKENVDYMMHENYRVWKETYEKAYGIPLEYTSKVTF